jgi:hypothetical protein
MIVKNLKAFDAAGCSVDEYKIWATQHNLKYYDLDTKKKFFNDLYEGKIKIIDSKIVDVEGE